MRNILFSLLFAPFIFLASKAPLADVRYTMPKLAVSCAPPALKATASTYFAKANFTAKQDGNWNDVNTWGGRLPGSGDIVGVPAGITVTVNASSNIKGLVADGDIIFNPGVSSTLTIQNGNFIYTGLLRSKPNSYLVKHQIIIAGINESGVVGNGMEPLDSDPGIWGMLNAKTDIRGEVKTSMTEAVASLPKGTTSFEVKEAVNWRQGDEITFNPTDELH